MKSFALFVGLCCATAAFAQQDSRESDRRPDRDRWRHYEPRPAPRVGEADPYAPKVGAPNPYATRAGDPNPYATRAGDPPRQLEQRPPHTQRRDRRR